MDEANEIYFCRENTCMRRFSSRNNLNYHIKSSHGQLKRTPCKYGCGKTYAAKSHSLRYHERTCNVAIGSGCRQQHYNNPQDIFQHHHHHQQQRGTSSSYMELVESAHKKCYKLYRKVYKVKKNIKTILRYGIITDVRNVIEKITNNVKFMLTISCIFQKSQYKDIFSDPPIFFKTLPIKTTSSTPLKVILEEMFLDIWNQIEEFIKNGSGWVLYKLENIDLQVCILITYFL